MADTRDIRAPAFTPPEPALVSIAALDRQLVRVRQRNVEQQKQRQQQLATFKRRARHTAYVLLGLLLLAAGLADLSSVIKDAVEAIPVIGWIIGVAASFFTAVCVGLPTYFARRRIQKMNAETKNIARANDSLEKTLERELARLRPALQTTGQISTLRSLELRQGPKFDAFKARMFLNIAIVQLLEAIPIVDLLPMQMAEVFYVIVQQQREFRQARNHILWYQQIDAQLRLLETFEREYLEAQLSAAVIQAIQAEQEAIDREQRELTRTERRRPTNPVTDIIPVV